MKWTLPSRNDKRGLVKREIKWNFQNTYTCSTFPFTVSVFFAPPRFGSGSTERELQAICASDSVVKGTEISLKRTEAHIWTHCIKMDIIKLYLESTIQINKLKNKRTVSGPFRLPSWKQRDCKIWVLWAQRSGKSPAEPGNEATNQGNAGLSRVSKCILWRNQLLTGYNLLSSEIKDCSKQCSYNVW